MNNYLCSNLPGTETRKLEEQVAILEPKSLSAFLKLRECGEKFLLFTRLQMVRTCTQLGEILISGLLSCLILSRQKFHRKCCLMQIILPLLEISY